MKIMSKINERGVVHLLFMILLLGGIGLGVYLVGQTQIFKPKASTDIPSGNAKLSDFWNQKAKWKFVRRQNFDDTYPNIINAAGGYIAVSDDGTWHLFSRKVFKGSDESCKGQDTNPSTIRITTEVRKSTDKGASWTTPVEIIDLSKEPAAKCGATDGGIYFDKASKRWHYLYQCIASDGVWNGCYAYRDGDDPAGEFTQIAENPVITKSGSKNPWEKICTDTSKDCYKIVNGNKFGEAGTFDIFHFDGKFYYVAFHGTDNKYGVRGFAKTADFINFIAGDESQGVPKDAVLDKFDAQNWEESWSGEGSIGFGEGGIIFENGYFYMTSGAADISLAVVPGQKWDTGLFRSQNLTNTKWEQFPGGNPIIYSGEDPNPSYSGTEKLCNPGYIRIFKDINGKYFLNYVRECKDWTESGLYLYELVFDNNLLKNADFRECSDNKWGKGENEGKKISSQVLRYPELSSDSGCVLETYCQTPNCEYKAAFHQDIEIDPAQYPKKTFTFGGKFRTLDKDTKPSIAVFQLRSDYSIADSKGISTTIHSKYSDLSDTFTLSDQTKILRYVIYPVDDTKIYADELYIENRGEAVAPRGSTIPLPSASTIAVPKLPIPTSSPTPIPSARDIRINYLKNPTFDTCTTASWNKITSVAPKVTNWATYKSTEAGSTGCLLAFNCHYGDWNYKICNGGESVFQDIDVSSVRGKSVSFGGNFWVGSGTGNLNVGVFQLDPNFKVVGNKFNLVTATSTKTLKDDSVTIDQNTKYLRLQLYPVTATQTFRVDDLYVKY